MRSKLSYCNICIVIITRETYTKCNFKGNVKLATEIFAETSDNSQHSARLISESRRYTVNFRRENVRTRIRIQIFMYGHYEIKYACVLGVYFIEFKIIPT
jgi:hypothetical protein